MTTGARAVIVAGMHRSGTSMIGGMLAACGVHMGPRLIAGDEANARGYFEDAEIVRFHGSVFRALLPRDARGHVDWGWTESQGLAEHRLDRFREEALRLVGRRSRSGGVWGFKDPRATLTLDLWDGCIEDARFVLVYRFPWQVADSMQRLGADVFLRNPAYGYRIWTYYSARIIDFYERNSGRCVLVSANGLPQGLGRFRESLCDKLGLAAQQADLERSFDARLFTDAGGEDPRAGLTAAAFPECTRLLGRLDDLADIPSDGSWRSQVSARAEPGAPDRPGPVDVSIVVPTFNDGVLLLDALASVEACRPPNSELIVVNDGSSDGETLRILDGLRARGYFVLDKENGGLSSARNAGIAQARGRYILPLDADNRLRPGFVEAARTVLDREEALGVVYGDRQMFGAVKKRVVVPDFHLGKMLAGNYIDACALYRRELWEDVGGYDTAMPGLEDWEFWLHAGRRGWRFRHLDRIALDYRVRPGSLLALSLGSKVRHSLMRHVLHKHVDAFYVGLPLPLRAASAGICRLAPESWHAPVRRVAAGIVWYPLWALVGPGGLFAGDRKLRRALAARPSA